MWEVHPTQGILRNSENIFVLPKPLHGYVDYISSFPYMIHLHTTHLILKLSATHTI